MTAVLEVQATFLADDLEPAVHREAHLKRVDRFLAGETLRSNIAWRHRIGSPPLRAGTGTSGLRHPYTVQSPRMLPTPGRTPPTGREILGLGDWQLILAREEIAQTLTILADPARCPHHPRTTSFADGIARCGKCGAGLTMTDPVASPPHYATHVRETRPVRTWRSQHQCTPSRHRRHRTCPAPPHTPQTVSRALYVSLVARLQVATGSPIIGVNRASRRSPPMETRLVFI